MVVAYQAFSWTSEGDALAALPPVLGETTPSERPVERPGSVATGFPTELAWSFQPGWRDKLETCWNIVELHVKNVNCFSNQFNISSLSLNTFIYLYVVKNVDIYIYIISK